MLSNATGVAKNTDSMNQSIPNLASLRQDIQIQQQVQQCLATLAQQQIPGMDQKIKSQRGGPDVFVKNRVRWPHEHVLSGSTKERVTYDQLTVIQWVSGFCRTMQEEKNSKMREYMLDYLVSLMDDATDFSWGAAKASHAVLLCRMEQGEIQDYSQIEKIDRIRRANAQKHVQPANLKSIQNDKNL